METLKEILDALRANRLRSFLTGFAIVWGIFMLILLLAAGNGFKNGMESNFFYMAKNTVMLYPGRTTMPYAGFQKGRQLNFKAEDIDYMEMEIRRIAKVEQYTPIFNIWNDTLTYKRENDVSSLCGVRPGYEVMRSLSIERGRFLNEVDERNHNKVVLIHPKTEKNLFKGEDGVGKFININNIPFKVVGIYTEKSESWRPDVYIPFSTSQMIFNPSGLITDISFSVAGVDTKEKSEALQDQLRQILARRLNFDPNDKEAVWIRDNVSNSMQSASIFSAIVFFIWIIGIGTLVAGIVGVGNIMLITIKERTKEFGIRKTLGATPASILKSVIFESLIITVSFGYIGLFLGIVLSETVSKIMESMPKSGDREFTIFMNPTIDLSIAITALIILVIAGTLAGYIPARKAVKIKPIVALQAK